MIHLADLIERNFDEIADLVIDAREKAPRVRGADGQPLDRDTGDVLVEVIRKLRRAEATAGPPPGAGAKRSDKHSEPRRSRGPLIGAARLGRGHGSD
jgi:hypothetical protein